MKIGVLGSGAVGQTLGGGFAKYDHEVKMGTRKPQADEIRKWIAATPHASAGSGGIIAARAIEPLCMLWCIPGLLHNQWTHAFKLLTR